MMDRQKMWAKIEWPFQQLFNHFLRIETVFKVQVGMSTVIESWYVCMWHPAGQQVPSSLQDSLSSWSMGKLTNYRRGTNWWLFGLTIAKLLYCHQTLVWTRQSQYNGWRKLLTLRAFHPYVQSVHGRCWSERPIEILLSLWSLMN